MFEKFASSRPALSGTIVQALRRYPLLRSVAYGVGMNLIGFAASHAMNPTGEREWSMPYVLAVHSLALPFMGMLSCGFAKLTQDDTDWWNQAIRKRGLRNLGLGVALGTSVYLLQTGTAATFGWVSFGERGWHSSSRPAVLWTLVTHMANFCVAWNEEMLYRGYGLYSLSKAIGLPGAMSILIPLFAWGHGSGWRTFVGQSALGFSMTALWLVGNSLWLPVGYHAAWNYVQTAVLGPPDAAASLLPMNVDGPEVWMGRPGYPEPGLLSTLANLVVAAGALVVWWRWRKQARPSQ